MSSEAIARKTAAYDHDDPSLKTGAGGLTVWTLQKMVQEKQFDELDKLFNNGVSLSALPVGMAAGAAVPIMAENKLVAEALEHLTGKAWRGKVFFGSNNKRVSEGRNRIKESLLLPHSPIVPMAKFDTMLLDSHPLAPRVKSNFVILSYADPRTRPYVVERLVAKFGFYDIQVAVRGKYGPVYIGKTWLGKYDKNGEFTAPDPDKTVAWYFLDFNEGALKEQREEHWDGSKEELFDTLPHVDN